MNTEELKGPGTAKLLLDLSTNENDNTIIHGEINAMVKIYYIC